VVKVNGSVIDGLDERGICEMFVIISPIKIEFVGICKNESEPINLENIKKD
jgi:hypothetical protein